MPGVYISWPFCSQKCTYCNFASGVFPRELERRYTDALAGELASASWPWIPETVYLGGGTPSSMDSDDLARLLSLISGRPWREATIEAAPGSISADNASRWRKSGLTRASLGVQSFVDRELRRTGRRHDAATVKREIEELRAAGIDEISIDLIAGLPGQTAASWDESLDWLERLAVPHVSIYMLEVDEDSRLGLEILQGGLRYGAPDAPTDDQVAAFYERAVERLRSMGLERYEISNFARPGHESAHNLKYWRLEPYLGFGADAHSFDGLCRRQTVETAADYVERRESGRSPLAAETPASLEEERFFVGLRLREGVFFSQEDWGRHRPALESFLSAGLLERNGDRLRLTDRGVLLSNEVFEEFVQTS